MVRTSIFQYRVAMCFSNLKIITYDRLLVIVCYNMSFIAYKLYGLNDIDISSMKNPP